MLEEKRFGVWLHDVRVGTLNQRGDYTWLQLDHTYVADPSRAVLGLVFEEDLHASHASALRLPSWFGHLLPEGRMREWIAADRGVSVQREMELLAHVGHDLPGAVSVLPEDQPPDAIDVEDLVAGASTDLAQPSDVWRFSLAGVGLKFSMIRQADRLSLPAFGRGGDWIVKMPDAKYDEVPRNEFAMMSLATQAGIETPEHVLVHRSELETLPERAWLSEEEWAYAVKRFDRLPGRAKVHIEDFAQVRNLKADGMSKYLGSYETVAALCYRGRDLEALKEFVRRLTFNILISNGDAHLKNWSLIYKDRRRPTLSPVYDLVSTALYAVDEDSSEDLGLKFGNSRRFETQTVGSFRRLGDKLGVDGEELEQVARQTIERVSDAWPSTMSDLDEIPKIRDSITWSLEHRRRSLLR